MNPDDQLKRAWQSQFSGRRVALNEDLILQQFRRHQHDLRFALYGTDLLMVVIGSVLLAITGYGLYLSARWAAWAAWGMLLMLLPIGGFTGWIIVDRLRHLHRCPWRDTSIKACAESMLAEINHRIWLARNVVWWFILPVIVIADAGFRCYVAWKTSSITGNPGDAVGPVTSVLVDTAFAGVIIYCLFRWLVMKGLQARKRELEQLLQSLEGKRES